MLKSKPLHQGFPSKRCCGFSDRSHHRKEVLYLVGMRMARHGFGKRLLHRRQHEFDERSGFSGGIGESEGFVLVDLAIVNEAFGRR